MGRLILNLWWRLVFWWKKRTGWLDMDQNAVITGTVVSLIPPDIDGDRCFNVKLDSGLEIFITLGYRQTTENPADGPSLHCEIPPWSPQWLKDKYDRLKVGDRVFVSGAWGYDGVHVNNWPMIIQIPLALIRHQPDMVNGWFEIHPVAMLEIL